ncbi:Uncharacterised protein [Klebsiella pneumoniae]|nr:Uncharacterised protein [Klebsiella pneumoniae]
MTIVKTHTGTVITRDGPKVKKLHQTERMWVVGKNEFYHKENRAPSLCRKYAPPVVVGND